jgi:hypothetical protein
VFRNGWSVIGTRFQEIRMSQLMQRLLAGIVALGLTSAVGCSKKNEEPRSVGPAASAPGSVGAPVASVILASPEACQACLAKTRCSELPGCTGIEGDDLANCQAVEKCIQDTNCADGTKTFTDCYCGSLKLQDCVDASKTGDKAPSGVCAAVIRKSLGGDEPTNRDILSRFTRNSFAGGKAIARLNCGKTKGCATECGF